MTTVRHTPPPTTHYKSATVEQSQNGTYSFSVSSEEPALMPLDVLGGAWAYEILSHDPSAIDLSKLTNKAPLLLEHNRWEQIGVIDSAAVVNKKLRVTARFSEAAAAIQKDVDQGIRSKVSIGYQVQEYTESDRTLDGKLVLIATKWTPIEVSMVSIPADDTVGVGRAAPVENDEKAGVDRTYSSDSRTPMENDRMAKADTTVASQKDDDGDDDESRTKSDDSATNEELAVTQEQQEQVADEVNHNRSDSADDSADNDANAEPDDDEDDNSDTETKSQKKSDASLISVRTRNTEVASIMKLAHDHNIPTTQTAQFIERGLDYDAVAREILTMKDNETPNLTAHKPLELSKAERREYSIREAINNAANGNRTGLVFEISDQMAKDGKKSYQNERSFFVPTSLSTPAGMRMGGGIQTRADLTTTTAGGSNAIFTQPGSTMIIDYLRNRTKVLALGAQVLSGLTGPVRFTRQNGTGDAFWRGEAQAQGRNALTLDAVTAQQHTLTNVQAFSREFLNVSSYDVEGQIVQDLVRSMAVRIDAAAISGSGTNAPLGIMNTSGIVTGSLGPSGSALSYSNIVSLVKTIEQQNADVETMGFLTTPGVKAQLLTTTKIPSGQYSDFVWSDDDTIRGYRAMISNNVPSTLSKGANSGNLSALLFGDFSQLVFCEWGGMEVVVDPYSLAPQGEIQITAYMYADVLLKHTQSFTYFNDVLAP